MRVYLSGLQAASSKREIDMIKAGVIRHRCFSFANIIKIPGLPYHLKGAVGAHDVCVENKVGIMMDSGVVSYRTCMRQLQRAGKSTATLPDEESFIQMYVDFVKKNHTKWDFYFTVDLEREAEKIYQRHCRLLKTGIVPTPIFHGDSTVDYLDRYRDLGHKLIGIASYKGLRSNQKQMRQYLDGVFNRAAKLGLDLHGLGFTAPWIMLDFPWWSVDSSAWSRVAGYGCILMFDETSHRMSTLHVSERHSTGKGADMKLNTATMRTIKRYIENQGYDWHMIQTDFVTRHIFNAASMNKLADTADKLHGGRTGRFALFV